MTTPEGEARREHIRRLIEERIPFNRLVGLLVEQLGDEEATLRIPYVDALIGDPFRPAIHGGVISMLADTAGGAATFMAAGEGYSCSTVDLRIDYLRPGQRRDLLANARVIRLGNRVSVVAIEVYHDHPRVHLADGRAVYNLRKIA